MARVTVEDCTKKVEDRFELVLLAAQRAKDLNSGIAITLDRDNDKDAVVALREIAEGNLKIDLMREGLIGRLQTRNKIDQIDDESLHSEKNDIIEECDYDTDISEVYVSDDHSDLDNDSGSFDNQIVDENP